VNGQRRLRIIGPGRAGRSLGTALESIGWTLHPYLGRDDDPRRAAVGVDLLVIATPDSSVAPVASAIDPSPETVVAHLSGSLDLDVLAPHPRAASLHPLVAMPDAERGRDRLLGGAWFAVAGDPLVVQVAESLGGHPFEVLDEDRATYHAAAVIASNHLVALMGQVERLAADIGVPREAYLDLARSSLDNVAELGASAALTGPAARGDWETLARHLAALPAGEEAAYLALAAQARRLVTPDGPGLPTSLTAVGDRPRPSGLPL